MTPRLSRRLILAAPAELLGGFALTPSMYGVQLAQELRKWSCYKVWATYSDGYWLIARAKADETRRVLNAIDAVDTWACAHGVERMAPDGTVYLDLPEGT